MNDETGLSAFRRYFWQPPRAHGQVIEDRRVSFLELFYDLVYVVVIAQAAHHLALHVSWRGVAEFAVVFGLIWVAWLNGSLYHDLHGREDGRTRAFVFVQMGILALLAVFTGDAFGNDGQAFAITYAVFLGLMTWLWYVVRREDDPAFRQMTGRYVATMVVSLLLVLASAFVGPQARFGLWLVLVAGFVVANFLIFRFGSLGDEGGSAQFGESMIERFGLFTIIVLGEVVVGVVTGIAESDRTALTIATGLVSLGIGFAFWWTFFDFVGSRAIRADSTGRITWVMAHFPVTAAFAAGGAAIVGLVEHAAEERTPGPTAWLLGGAVAVALLGVVLIARNLADWDRLPGVYRPLAGALSLAAFASIGLAALRPAPWLLAASLVVLLNGVWLFAIVKAVRTTDPDETIPTLGS